MDQCIMYTALAMETEGRLGDWIKQNSEYYKVSHLSANLVVMELKESPKWVLNT